MSNIPIDHPQYWTNEQNDFWAARVEEKEAFIQQAKAERTKEILGIVKGRLKVLEASMVPGETPYEDGLMALGGHIELSAIKTRLGGSQ